MKCAVNGALRALGDLLFPRLCAVCGKRLDVGEISLCGACGQDMPFTWFWSRAENPAEKRMWERVGIVSAASLYFYRHGDGYDSLIQQVKYGDNLRLGRRLGGMLGERMRRGGRFSDLQAVVPVPLYPLRRWKRGYNQAEIIAQGIAAAFDIPLVAGLLRRGRHTRTQTRMDRRGRAENVRNAFRIDRTVADRLVSEGIVRILVVDDVLTTGATIEGCAQALIWKNPTVKISVATLAYAHTV